MDFYYEVALRLHDEGMTGDDIEVWLLDMGLDSMYAASITDRVVKGGQYGNACW